MLAPTRAIHPLRTFIIRGYLQNGQTSIDLASTIGNRLAGETGQWTTSSITNAVAAATSAKATSGLPLGFRFLQ